MCSLHKTNAPIFHHSVFSSMCACVCVCNYHLFVTIVVIVQFTITFFFSYCIRVHVVLRVFIRWFSFHLFHSTSFFIILSFVHTFISSFFPYTHNNNNCHICNISVAFSASSFREEKFTTKPCKWDR